MTHSQGGLGIGLTLVKNLVEMHHGSVEAHSAGLGKGSEFTIRLPLSTQNGQGTIEAIHEEKQQTEGTSLHRLLVGR